MGFEYRKDNEEVTEEEKGENLPDLGHSKGKQNGEILRVKWEWVVDLVWLSRKNPETHLFGDQRSSTPTLVSGASRGVRRGCERTSCSVSCRR